MNTAKKNLMGGSSHYRNAGRKPKYDEPTVTLSFKWPLSFVADLKDLFTSDERAEEVMRTLKKAYGIKLTRTNKFVQSKNTGSGRKEN